MKKLDDYFKIVLEKFKPLFKKAIEMEIKLGTEVTNIDFENNTDKTPSKTLGTTKTDINVLTDTINRLVKGANEDISKKINTAINEGILQKKSQKEISRDIENIFKENQADYFNYKKRFETISRTESSRVLNYGAYSKAKKLKAKKKYVGIVEDNRTSNICLAMKMKYGTPDKAIPIDDNFEVEVNGKKTSELLPPFHPNCRSFVLYVYK